MAVITKMHLAEIVEFDWEAVKRNIEAVRPGMQIIPASAKTGYGMQDWLDLLHEWVAPATPA
ncbi:MAG TPA: hypothetical protein VGL97_19660 [Bryobacteraceae bacterium]